MGDGPCVPHAPCRAVPRGGGGSSGAKAPGGERQRAVLAMGRGREADVLLLDEPTVPLDPAHQVAMLRLVRELACAGGFAVAAVLHDLNLAASMAARIAVIADGRVVCDAVPESVINAQLIRDVFGAGLAVGRHDGRPVGFPVP